MAAILIGYTAAIAIIFPASRPFSINRHVSGRWSEKMAQTDQLARLLVFLLLGYFALTAAATFAFTFVW